MGLSFSVKKQSTTHYNDLKVGSIFKFNPADCVYIKTEGGAVCLYNGKFWPQAVIDGQPGNGSVVEYKVRYPIPLEEVK